MIHCGGADPGFIVFIPAIRSLMVFPLSSLMRAAWCSSFPLFVSLNVVTPAGIWSGASSLYSVAVTFTTFGAAATAAGATAGPPASSSDNFPFVKSLLFLLSILVPGFTARAQTPEPPQVAREFRAIWVATVANIDWPSRPGLTTWQQ